MHRSSTLRARLAAVTFVAALASPAAPAARETDAVRMIGLSSEQVELVTHLVDLYDQAGLELPPVVFRIGTDVPLCEHRPGLHSYSDGTSEIVLCYPKIAGREYRILLHELAHAWARVGLTEERRAAFKELRGWEHWHDYGRASWRENGTEQAAEIIKWGVSDRSVRLFIDDVTCDELRDGYRVLTGREARYGSTDPCGAQPAGRVASSAQDV